MGEREIFNEINEILTVNGYDIRINNLNDLKNFLNEESRSDNKVYDDIRALYDQFVMGVGMW
ncbi:MAG: hypothetical protein ACOYWZ_12165 [Bacillota bacterium]